MMNKQLKLYFGISLGSIVIAIGFLSWLKENQVLSEPGLNYTATDDPVKVSLSLPTEVLNYEFKEVEIADLTLETLPADTSIGKALYTRGNQQILIQCVMMGSDRTSIHQPQYCLVGSGWTIDEQEETTIPVYMPERVEMPVMKLTSTKMIMDNQGNEIPYRGIMTYWFVSEDLLTARHWERMWWMAKGMLTSGKLQRWAYVACIIYCPPGYEDVAYKDLETFVSAAIPQFQKTVPRPRSD
jgi:hypothetical protein